MQWILGRGKKTSLPGLVGIYESPQGIALAYSVCNSKKPPSIKAQVYRKGIEVEEKRATLSTFIVENGLQGMPCSYVLASQEYTLSMLDCPAVAKEEISSALRWVVRDMVNFPVTDAVIDTFELPLPRSRDNMKMVYAAVIRKTVIPRIVDFTKKAELVLKNITIPEIVLKNVISYHPENAKGCAFIQLTLDGGKLILCRNNIIYITRSFDLKLDALLSEDEQKSSVIFETLAVEIQRSFDYFSSVFRQTIHNVIVLAPTIFNMGTIQVALEKILGTPIQVYDLSDYLSFEHPIKKEEQAECLLAIGATLLPEEKPI